MTFTFVCNHCNNEFLACASLPGQEEQVCPRCSWGTYKWKPDDIDTAMGSPYVLFTTGREYRLGRETAQLRHEGLFHLDFGTGELERGTDYIPHFI